jgi:type I restriction enzyme S subunit
MRRLLNKERDIANFDHGPNQELPEGWARGNLEDLIGQDGIFCDGDWVESKDQDPNGDVRLIQLADIGDGLFKNKSRRFLNVGKAKELGCTFLKKGDVLIARMPEPLGRSCIFPGDITPAVTAVDICIVRSGKNGANQEWIKHIINSHPIRSKIELLEKGTTRKRISRRNLASLTIPIPPLPEQRRIAEKVDELSGRVNSVRARLARVQAILKRFRQSVLSAACSGRLTADWRAQQLDVHSAEDLLSSILAERRKSPKEVSSEGNEIKSSAFNELPMGWALTCGAHLFVWSSGKFLPEKKQNKGPYPIYGGNGITGYHSEYLVEHPTLVIGRVGALCGNVYLTSGEAWVTDNAIYATWVPTKLNLNFIEMIFSHANLNANAGGSGQPFVNQTILNDLLIPLPSLAEQNEIVQRVGNLLRLADAIEKTLAAGSSRVEKLTQSILAKAFRGELVPTEAELACREGRSYEPASTLLARIKAEREARRGSISVKRARRR